MSTKTMKSFQEVQSLIGTLCDPSRMSRTEYREFLEEISGFCEMSLEALTQEETDE